MAVVRQTDILKQWKGTKFECSKQYVSKLVNVKGMPIESFESVDEATVWRQNHLLNGPRGKGRRKLLSIDREPAKRQLSENPPPAAGSGVDLDGDGLDAMLSRVYCSEREAFKLLDLELKKEEPVGLQLLQRNHTQAVKIRVEAEATALKLKEQAGELVSLDFAKQLVGSILKPLQGRLDSLPRLCGHKANPENPVLAEGAIRDTLAGLFREIERGLEGLAA